MSDTFATGGMYDTSTVSYADRRTCHKHGHDVREWGTLSGWCHRCKHTVMTRSTRGLVLSRGEFFDFPPAHPSIMNFAASEADPPRVSRMLYMFRRCVART